MKIRPFVLSDLAATYSVQAKCPRAAQWRPEDYSLLAELPGGMVLVADLATTAQPEVVGFAAFHRVADEAELRNIAVSPEHQRRGAARALLQEGVRRLHQLGTRCLFLEVRASNGAALALYTTVGFKRVSTRKGYYQDPEEDACVMALDLGISVSSH